MIILGVDTSGRDGSVAIARATESGFEVLEVVSLAGGTYSAQLIPAIAGMLERQGLRKTDLDGFAVASGPGSFTGLRVGLSAVKGFAEIFHKPIAPVSVLEAVAVATHDDGLTISALDAARKEMYVGEYEVIGGHARLLRESLMTQLDFSQLLENNESAQLITPDATIAELAHFHTRVMQIDRPQADEFARLGYLKITAGQVVPPDVLEANYMRRSDAEILLSKPGR